MPENNKWHYHVITVGSVLSSPKDEDLEELLNELGNQGWEIFAIHHHEGSNKLRMVGKKPVFDNPRRKRTWPG